jgi:hypothetical protein
MTTDRVPNSIQPAALWWLRPNCSC